MRRHVLLTTILGLSLTVIIEAQDPEIRRTTIPSQSFNEAFENLQNNVSKIEGNLQQQEKAWPNADQARDNEQAPPLAVVSLQKKHRRLLQEQKSLLNELQALSRHRSLDLTMRSHRYDPGPLLEKVKSTRDEALLAVVLPLVTKVGKGHSITEKVLIDLAQKQDPCPESLSEALSSLRNRGASFYLLKLGVRTVNSNLLIDAGRSGHPAVINKMITIFNKSKAGVAMGLEVFAKLVPPPDADREELSRVIVRRLDSVEDVSFKAVLISYLGLCEISEDLSFLETIYSSSDEERIRLAAVSSMGRFGTSAVSFLEKELKNQTNSLPVLRACLHALTAIADRNTVPTLLAFLEDPDLARPAERALGQIARGKVARSSAEWRRWWSQQPESRENGTTDPDLGGKLVGKPKKRWEALLKASRPRSRL